MLLHNLFYDIAPKILPVGRLTKVTIRPLYDHVQLNPEGR